VKVGPERSGEIEKKSELIPRSASMEIQLSKEVVRIAGNVDVVMLLAAIECLV
jgi:hypothetical protein